MFLTKQKKTYKVVKHTQPLECHKIEFLLRQIEITRTKVRNQHVCLTLTLASERQGTT